MDQQELKGKDRNQIIWGQSIISEVLNRKRFLEFSMMLNLHKERHIPAEVLLQNTQNNGVPKT
jgi:antitoxin component HigA of HigAB toxin-antitoxin module